MTVLRGSVRRRIAKTHRPDPLAKPDPARVRSWTSRISPCLRCLTPHEAALSVVGMSTLPVLNRLPPITIGASHRLRLVHFRSPSLQAQDTALRRSYNDRPSRGTREGARALWLDRTPGQLDRPRLSSQRRVQPTPSSPLFPDRSLTGVFGSSGPCSSEGLTAEDMLERRRVCRIFGRGICRALGAEHIRHGRAASKEVLTRRRLSLDYVLEHPGLPRQSARVRADRGVHMRHRGACAPKRIFMCAPALPYVAGCPAVAPRPPERRCRSGASGRGRERPPLLDASIGIAEGGHVRAHATLRRGVSPGPSIPSGKAAAEPPTQAPSRISVLPRQPRSAHT